MQTPPERIAALEEALLALRRETEILAALPIHILRVAIDKLVDEREVSAEWRNDLWREIDKELAEIGTVSPAIRRAAQHAVPTATYGQIIQASRRGDRKPLLRPKQRPASDDAEDA